MILQGYADTRKADPPAILLEGWVKCSHTCECGAKVWWGKNINDGGSLNDGTNVRCWKCEKVALVGPRP